jgi:phenylalanyl-tRNA synthetase beta chain
VTKETLTAIVPSYRADDITIPEDLIEEVARVYGYHNLPSILPPVVSIDPVSIENDMFRWETRVKNALKYWGFTEVYTYPMVSEDMYEGPLESAVALSNPLGEEFVYMRRTLIPNLLKIVEDNRNVDTLHLFEIANIYEAREKDLPKEIRTLALVIKNKTKDYFDMKGVIEQLAQDCGINNLTFGTGGSTSLETRIYLGKNEIGRMEILDEHFINAEINFDLFLSHVSIKKTYTKLSKFPSVFEDITLIGNNKATHEVIVETIKNTSKLVRAVTLNSKFKDARTYHIEYQDKEKNLSSNDVKEIRENILSLLHKNLNLQEK